MSRFVNLEFGDEHEDQSQIHQKSAGQGRGALSRRGANAAFENGRFESALRRYSKVLEYNPQNAAAWTGQVRMLIELAEYREARLWATRRWKIFRRSPNCWQPKPWRWAAVATSRKRSRFRTPRSRNGATLRTSGWRAVDVLLAREEPRADYCFDKALGLAPANWVVAWLAARIRLLLRAVRAGIEVDSAGGRIECRPLSALAGTRPLPARARIGRAGRHSYSQALQLNPHSSEVKVALGRLSEIGLWSRLRGWWRRFFNR
jgi:tetratricopeptide (TPR) repeat protein